MPAFAEVIWRFSPSGWRLVAGDMMRPAVTNFRVLSGHTLLLLFFSWFAWSGWTRLGWVGGVGGGSEDAKDGGGLGELRSNWPVVR